MSQQKIHVSEETTPIAQSALSFIDQHEAEQFWLSDWLRSLTEEEVEDLSRQTGRALDMTEEELDILSDDLIATAFVIYAAEFDSEVIAESDVEKVPEFLEAMNYAAILVLQEKRGDIEYVGNLSMFDDEDLATMVLICDVPEEYDIFVISCDYH